MSEDMHMEEEVYRKLLRVYDELVDVVSNYVFDNSEAGLELNKVLGIENQTTFTKLEAAYRLFDRKWKDVTDSLVFASGAYVNPTPLDPKKLNAIMSTISEDAAKDKEQAEKSFEDSKKKIYDYLYKGLKKEPDNG